MFASEMHTGSDDIEIVFDDRVPKSSNETDIEIELDDVDPFADDKNDPENHEDYFAFSPTVTTFIHPRPVIGFPNLGNTCFLNSAMQCLFSCEEFSKGLAELSDREVDEKQVLLKATVLLFKAIWSGDEAKVNSLMSGFKGALGSVDRRFAGYRQEDSQEALLAVIDGIHEDLRKTIKTNESVNDEELGDKKDSDGWIEFLKKNNTLSTRCFTGQLKSTVKCPRCAFESTTFDPFNVLSLPIRPLERKKVEIKHPVKVFYYERNGSEGYLVTRKVLKNFEELRGMDDEAEYFLVVNSESTSKINDEGDFDQLRNQNAQVIVYSMTRNDVLVDFRQDSSALGYPLMIKLSDEMRSVESVFGAIFAVFEELVKHRAPDNLETYREICRELLDCIGDVCEIERSKDSFNRLTICLKERNDEEESWQRFSKIFSDDLDEFFSVFVDSTKPRIPFTQPEPIKYPVKAELSECFEEFLKEETLEVCGDGWCCDNCKQRSTGEIKKKFDFWRLPTYLIVHLKRFAVDDAAGGGFGYYGFGYRSHKIETEIDFPVDELILKSGFKGDRVYELQAVSLHGGSLYSGHYTALVRRADSDDWFKADDSFVRPVERAVVESSGAAAYFLIYKKK